MISVQCDACFVPMDVPDKYAGKKVKCKECGEPVLVAAKNSRPDGRTSRGGDEEVFSDNEFPADESHAETPRPGIRRSKAGSKGKSVRKSKGAVRNTSPLGALGAMTPLHRNLAFLGLYAVGALLSVLSPSDIFKVFFMAGLGLGALMVVGGFVLMFVQSLIIACREDPLTALRSLMFLSGLADLFGTLGLIQIDEDDRPNLRVAAMAGTSLKLGLLFLIVHGFMCFGIAFTAVKLGFVIR
jgi:hypothetical protein